MCRRLVKGNLVGIGENHIRELKALALVYGHYPYGIFAFGTSYQQVGLLIVLEIVSHFVPVKLRVAPDVVKEGIDIELLTLERELSAFGKGAQQGLAEIENRAV